MKTLLVGNFGALNLGDELILYTALKKYPDAVVMCANGEASQKFLEKSFETMNMPPTGIRSFFLQLFSGRQVSSKIDQVVFPGGGLFAIRTKAYFIWYIVILWTSKTFPQAGIILEHQGVDEPRNFLEGYFLKKALSKVQNVSVRDKSSAQVIHKYSHHKAKVVGDIVEMYHDTSQGQKPKTKNQKLLLVNAMKEYDKQSLQKKFPSHKIIEVAFDPKDLGLHPKTKKELLDLLNQADIVVGERFHSLVLGNCFCPQKTYLLRDPYSKKVKDLQGRMNLNKC